MKISIEIRELMAKGYYSIVYMHLHDLIRRVTSTTSTFPPLSDHIDEFIEYFTTELFIQEMNSSTRIYAWDLYIKRMFKPMAYGFIRQILPSELRLLDSHRYNDTDYLQQYREYLSDKEVYFEDKLISRMDAENYLYSMDSREFVDMVFNKYNHYQGKMYSRIYDSFIMTIIEESVVLHRLGPEWNSYVQYLYNCYINEYSELIRRVVDNSDI